MGTNGRIKGRDVGKWRQRSGCRKFESWAFRFGEIGLVEIPPITRRSTLRSSLQPKIHLRHWARPGAAAFGNVFDCETPRGQYFNDLRQERLSAINGLQ